MVPSLPSCGLQETALCAFQDGLCTKTNNKGVKIMIVIMFLLLLLFLLVFAACTCCFVTFKCPDQVLSPLLSILACVCLAMANS